ncbi:MAG: hypothetical protein H6Q90_1964 [Deltaproteobacteria bacterium]|nr:hypothetical protein [Deltaproteobacteria bacterium]
MRGTLILLAVAAGCGGSSPADGTPDDAGVTGGADGANGGGDGAIPACPAGQWCFEPAQSTQSLRAVAAVDPGDVFAVGEGGTILRRRNQAWTAMESGTTSGLRGVWAASSSDVWAVGVAGTILHFDGTAWTAKANVTTIDVEAVWGSSASDVWMVGSRTVLHWNGAQITATARPGILFSITGSGPNDVWATGETAYLQHFDGTWNTVHPGVGGLSFFEIASVGANELWLSNATPNQETFHFTGGSWTPQGTGAVVFQSVYAAAANDVWGAGGTKVGHWNGAAWTTEQPAGTSAAFWAVSGAGPDVWVVGDGGLIAHRF